MSIHYCKKCDTEIYVPALSAEDMKIILGYIADKSLLRVVQFLKEDKQLTLKEGKLIVDHLCELGKKCNRCDYDQLKEEFEVCPKCKSFNISWR
jgi:hypothetical protein